MHYERVYQSCGILQHSNAHSGRPLIVVSGSNKHMGAKQICWKSCEHLCTHVARVSEYWDFTVPGSTWQYVRKLLIPKHTGTKT